MNQSSNQKRVLDALDERLSTNEMRRQREARALTMQIRLTLALQIASFLSALAAVVGVMMIVLFMDDGAWPLTLLLYLYICLTLIVLLNYRLLQSLARALSKRWLRLTGS